jgi:hypothetical protein
MSKLTITLTLTDEEADALCELLARGVAQTTYAPRLAQLAGNVEPYVKHRVDDARIARGRKLRKEAK